MLLCALALLGPLPARAQFAPPPVAESVNSIVARARALSFDEDSDEESFGIDGPEPLPNFHQVHAGLYRSGQPNREGFARLKALGIKTILVLRRKVGDDERAEAARLGLRLEHVSMNGITSPSFSALDRALKIADDPSLQPVLVHCRYGKDRTGATIAAQRVSSGALNVADAAAQAHRYGCCVPLFIPLKPYLSAYRRHQR